MIWRGEKMADFENIGAKNAPYLGASVNVTFVPFISRINVVSGRSVGTAGSVGLARPGRGGWGAGVVAHESNTTVFFSSYR